MGWGGRREAQEGVCMCVCMCVCVCVCAKVISVVSDSATLWSVAYQVSLSMGILQVGILEWVTMCPSRESSQPRDQTASHTSPVLVGRFFTTSATWEAHTYVNI